MADITDKQQEVLNQIDDLLKEHFASSFMIVECDSGDDSDEFHRVIYQGGRANAIGMLRIGEILLTTGEISGAQRHEDEDED